jgi:peptidoglycan/LPS O-acetylase OafA/YrhL
MTLQERFDARRNNFDLIRLMLAVIVAGAHAVAIRTGDQPYFGINTTADFALDGFFILSGFLVTRSWLILNDFWRYAWHRFLRIMPGFWVCLLVLAFVVAPTALALEGRPLSELFSSPDSAIRFVLINSGLMVFTYEIASVFANNPLPLSVDGSLWTLILEAGCYFVLACLGLIGVLRRRKWVVPVFALLLWTMATLYDFQIYQGIGNETLRMLMLFMIGASLYLFADRVPMRFWLAVAATVVFLGSAALLDNYRMVGAVPFAYLLIYLAAGLPWTLRLRTDLSYGAYIYHWPVEQLLMLTVLARLPTAAFVTTSLILIIPVALMSWFGIERRALHQKNARLPTWLPGAVAPQPPARARQP